MPDDQRQKSTDNVDAAVWIVALICVFAPAGVSSVAPEKILANPRTLDEDKAKAFLQIFALTGPLVLGVGFLTLCYLRQWFARNALAVLLITSVLVLVCGFAGFGVTPNVPQDVPNAGPFKIVLVVLYGYAEVTGWKVTIASLALGWLAGYVAYEKMPDDWKRNLDAQFKDKPADGST